MEEPKKPNCYKCVHRLEISGDAHSRCNNHKAKVQGSSYGISKRWFSWPLSFDPTWLISCDGFSDDEKDKMPRHELDPLIELLAMLK